MRLRTVPAILVALGLVTCKARTDQGPRLQPPPSFESLMDTSRWSAWQGPGFTISHPTNVTVLPDTDRFSGFVGTAMRWDFGRYQWLRIAFSTLRPSPTKDLGHFVDSTRVARNTDLDPDWRLAPASPMSLAGLRAFELRPNCGDCVAYEFYLDLPTGWVVASFSLEQNAPYTYEQQEALYRRILGTLRPSGS